MIIIEEKQYKLIDEPNESKPNWHLLEENFEKDGDGNKTTLVVPSTPEEKVARGYEERNTYKITKDSIKKKDSPLMRPILNPSYDSAREYLSRDQRRKEWCIVGLLGQVPIRDTAIIPTAWKKMKNLESGIDLYFIK